MTLDLNYHHLYYFWTTAKAGRVTGAAKQLGLSQSALSVQLKSLERSLGRVLLDRRSAGLELTEVGRTVFEHCEKIFTHGAALSDALRGASPTVIRLGVTSALGREAAMIFIDRLAKLEGTTVTVYIGPRGDIVERLTRRTLDIAVVGADLTPDLGAGFSSKKVHTLPINFFASPALALAMKGFPAEGQKVPMLFRTRDYAPRHDVERFIRERGAIPVTVAESEDADILQTLARRGRGVVALHRPSTQADLAARALVRIGPARTGLYHEVWVLSHAHESVNPAVRKAVAIASQR